MSSDIEEDNYTTYERYVDDDPTDEAIYESQS
jgi:hypothetical protein